MNPYMVIDFMERHHRDMGDIKNEFQKLLESVVNSTTIKPETEKEILFVLSTIIGLYEQGMYLGLTKKQIVQDKQDSIIESFTKTLLDSHENLLSETNEFREKTFKELRDKIITYHDDLFDHLLEHVTYTDQK